MRGSQPSRMGRKGNGPPTSLMVEEDGDCLLEENPGLLHHATLVKERCRVSLYHYPPHRERPLEHIHISLHALSVARASGTWRRSPSSVWTSWKSYSSSQGGQSGL